METEVNVEFADSDVWNAVEDNVQEQITNFIDEHISEYEHASQDEGIGDQVYELLLDYKNGITSCAIGKAFEQAVWKAITRLDNPNVADEVWASAAKEYLLSVVPGSRDVRAIVREELFNLVRLMIEGYNPDPESGAEIAVAPGD